jgi:hypothetical protein
MAWLYHKEAAMIALLDITTVTIATLFALAAATALHWVLLRIAFRVMRPSPTSKHLARPELVRGRAQLARAYAGQR